MLPAAHGRLSAQNTHLGIGIQAPGATPTTHADRPVSALSRLEAWPRSVTDLGAPHGERSTVASWVSSQCGAFPPVDGFCIGGHAIKEAGDELDMSAAASGEAELPQFRDGTVVVVVVSSAA